MGTTVSVQTYPLSEFPNTKANTATLEAETVAAGLSVALLSPPYEQSGAVSFQFGGLLTAADVALLDAVVAAHQGTDFEGTPAQTMVNAEDSDDTGAEVERGSLSVGPLPQGNYVLIWGMQVACTTAGGQTEARVTASVNGAAAVELDTGTERQGDWASVSGSASVEAEAGTTYEIKALYQRAGASGNPAKVRRVRLFVARLL